MDEAKRRGPPKAHRARIGLRIQEFAAYVISTIKGKDR
jgi:hypothetical protein